MKKIKLNGRNITKESAIKQSTKRNILKTIITTIFLLTLILNNKALAVTLTQKLGNETVNATVEEGAKVTMKFKPKSGYTFKKWTVEAGNIGEYDEHLTTITFTMPNHDVTIRGEYYGKTTLTINPGEGTYDGKNYEQTISQDYKTTKEINDAEAPEGYKVEFIANDGTVENAYLLQTNTFQNWTLIGGGELNQNTYTFGE